MEISYVLEDYDLINFLLLFIIPSHRNVSFAVGLTLAYQLNSIFFGDAMMEVCFQ